MLRNVNNEQLLRNAKISIKSEIIRLGDNVLKQRQHLKRSIIGLSDSKTKFSKLTVAAIVSASLVGCGGEIDQASSNQDSSWSRAAVVEIAGENCEYGGQKIESGTDTNNDGILQDSEINQVDFLCDIKTTETYSNDMSDLSDNFWRTFSIYQEDNSTADTDISAYRFQGDLKRFKRGTNTEEYIDYIVDGGIESAVATAYYWEGDSPADAPMRLFVSKVGGNNSDDWLELTVTQEKVGSYESQEDDDTADQQNDNWEKFEFAANDVIEDVGEGYDFIRVQFSTVVSGQAWHPQLGNLDVTYTPDAILADDNNAAPAPAVEPRDDVIVAQTDGINDFSKVFSHSDSLFFDTGDGENGSRFHDDGSRLKRGTNTAEYVQYELAGAVQSIEVIAHYWNYKEAEKFIIMASKTGGDDPAEWTTLADSHLAVGDAVEDWTQHNYTAELTAEQADFDFIRVIFPILAEVDADGNAIDAPAWSPQLGDVNIIYLENYGIGDDNVSRDLSTTNIGGGQALLAVDSTITDTMTANNASTLFSHYVTRGGGNGNGESNKLYDNDQGKEFRFVSYNTPNLVMTEDPIWDITPVFEQEDGIRTIKDMGGKVTRIYTMGIFNSANAGKIKHISWDENGVLVFNEDIFVAMDNLLAIANKHGVRIQVPFIDRSLWWGGIAHFAAQYGKTKPEFFSDRATIDGFKEVISYVLNRVNTVTGVAYKDDPAIFAWETGNELRSDSIADIEAWTQEIAAHIKSIDNKHLVMDGREARSTQETGEFEMRMSNAALFDTNIDIVSNHYYGTDFENRIDQDVIRVAGAKPFVVGEIGFGDIETEAAINKVDSSGSTGIFLWSLRTHDIRGGFKDHADAEAHAYHWPGFYENSAYHEQTIMTNAWQMAYLINGEAVPVGIPAPAYAPVMLASPSNLDIRWQGVASAQYYNIERSDNGTDGWVLVGDSIEIGGTNESHYVLADRIDSMGNVVNNVKHQILFQDGGAVENQTYYYRAQAINESGASDWSNVISSTAELIVDGIVQDTLSTFASAAEVSDLANLHLDSGNAEYFKEGEGARIKRGANDSEDFFRYSFAGDINSFWIRTYFWSNTDDVRAGENDFKVQLSSDGTSWDDFASEVILAERRGDWQQIDLVGRGLGSSGYKHLRVIFPIDGPADTWAQQLGNVIVGVGSAMPELPPQQTADGLIVDDFESYASTSALKNTYKDLAWANPSLDESGDSKRLKLSYDVADLFYAGIGRDYASPQDWSVGNALQFYLSHQNAGNILVLQIEEKAVQLRGDGKPDVWEFAMLMDDSNLDGDIIIKFSDFGYPHWYGDDQINDASVFDLDDIYKLNIYINSSYTGFNPANNATGENLLIDDITVVTVD